MIIVYSDEIGLVARQVDEYGIQFCDGEVYFSDTNGKEYVIPVDSVTEINKGELYA